MGPAPFTGAPSKGYANTSRGQKRERQCSLLFHQGALPVLVCPRVLREQGMGQCDLVRLFLHPRRLEILEIKGATTRQVSQRQWLRLKKTGEYLAKVFSASVILSAHTEA